MKAKKMLTVALLFGVLGLVPFYAAKADDNNVYRKPYLYVVKSASSITSKDTINFTALAVRSDASPVTKITMTVGNNTIVCENSLSCQQTFGPFEVTKNTWVKYKIVAEINNKSQKNINTGSFLVKPIKIKKEVNNSNDYKYTCVDIDTKDNTSANFDSQFFLKGKTTYSIYWNNNPAISLEPQPGEDYCEDTKTLMEYSCDGKLEKINSPKGGYKIIPTKQTCTDGCLDGACTKKETTTQDNFQFTCTDTDLKGASDNIDSRFFSKGKATYSIYWNNNPAISLGAEGEDYCSDSKTLIEYSCDGKLEKNSSPKGGYILTPFAYSCANSCVEGACVK